MKIIFIVATAIWSKVVFACSVTGTYVLVEKKTTYVERKELKEPVIKENLVRGKDTGTWGDCSEYGRLYLGFSENSPQVTGYEIKIIEGNPKIHIDDKYYYLPKLSQDGVAQIVFPLLDISKTGIADYPLEFKLSVRAVYSSAKASFPVLLEFRDVP